MLENIRQTFESLTDDELWEKERFSLSHIELDRLISSRFLTLILTVINEPLPLSITHYDFNYNKQTDLISIFNPLGVDKATYTVPLKKIFDLDRIRGFVVSHTPSGFWEKIIDWFQLFFYKASAYRKRLYTSFLSEPFNHNRLLLLLENRLISKNNLACLDSVFTERFHLQEIASLTLLVKKDAIITDILKVQENSVAIKAYKLNHNLTNTKIILSKDEIFDFTKKIKAILNE